MIPRLPPSPPAPPEDSAQLFTSGLWQRWFSALSSRLAVFLAVDKPPGVAVASGVSTVVYRLPEQGAGVFMISCDIGPVGSAVDYGSWAIVVQNGDTSRVVALGNAAKQTLGVVGLDVSSVQSSGLEQVLRVSVAQIG